MERLSISRLALSDFRSYRNLRLETDDSPVVLTGANGAGKTNLLEALSFLAPGRGLRRAKLAEVARKEAGPEAPWAVAAAVRRDGRRIEIGTGREVGSERRAVRIDGEPARSQAALGEVVSVLWLTPAMDRLFLEGAAGRRRFLDRLVLGLDPGHAARASAYEHALRERSRLLRQGRFDPAWLGALEQTMAARGVEMAAARRDLAGRLEEACAGGVGIFPGARLMVEGAVEGWLAEMPAEAAAERLRQALAAGRRRDAEAGGAAEGPHRSDLKVRHAAKDIPAEQCSTGEQKALLIAIVLGQARIQKTARGVPPILLLDEVAAHLDGERRAALYEELAAMPAQSWLTGTDAALFAPFGERAQFFRVDGGAVTRQREG